MVNGFGIESSLAHDPTSFDFTLAPDPIVKRLSNHHAVSICESENL